MAEAKREALAVGGGVCSTKEQEKEQEREFHVEFVQVAHMKLVGR